MCQRKWQANNRRLAKVRMVEGSEKTSGGQITTKKATTQKHLMRMGPNPIERCGKCLSPIIVRIDNHIDGMQLLGQ